MLFYFLYFGFLSLTLEMVIAADYSSNETSGVW